MTSAPPAVTTAACSTRRQPSLVHQYRARREHDQAEQDQAIGKKDGDAEEQSADQCNREAVAASADDRQGKPAGRDTGEQPVGRYRHPDRSGEERREGNRPPGRSFVAQLAHA